MGLDIRLPIGLMFTLLGILLIVAGFVMDRAIYHRSLGININLWWGIAMLAFGLLMLALGRRQTAAMHPADESVEGQKIEEREHRTGLEKESSTDS